MAVVMLAWAGFTQAGDIDVDASELTFGPNLATLTVPVTAAVPIDVVVHQGIATVEFATKGAMNAVERVKITKDGNFAVSWRLNRQASVDEIRFYENGGNSRYEITFNLGGELAVADAVPVGDERLTIVVDPGHGGFDPGAIRGNDIEKDLVRVFAEELEVALFEAGHTVVLTRAGDSFVSLDERRRIAKEQGADLFLSFHADAILEGDASGLTFYTLRPIPRERLTDEVIRYDAGPNLFGEAAIPGLPIAAQSGLIFLGVSNGRALSQRFAEALAQNVSPSAQPERSRLMLEGDFGVLKSASPPSVLVELGFMSNTQDLAQLKRQDWRNNVIQGIVAGIEDWTRQKTYSR